MAEVRNGSPQGIAHMARVASFGCVVANKDCMGRCEAHHLIGLDYRGKGQKASDFETIPLCTNHHTGYKGKPEGIAIHANPELWESRYNTQEFYLEQTRIMLQMVYPDWCHMTGKPYR